jgi:putative two-component system response regulator
MPHLGFMCRVDKRSASTLILRLRQWWMRYAHPPHKTHFDQLSNNQATSMTAYQPLILIVDDQPYNLMALREILDEDYRLLFARTGTEALTVVAKRPPDLILLDITMPDLDGYTVCRTLKADPKTAPIPVIFVTDLGAMGDEMAGFAAGAVDYITKPLSAPIVKARVKTHCSLVNATLLQQSYRDSLAMLGVASHYNDNDTGNHIWRMADYAQVLAQACGWDQNACQRLKQAAPMHDMGKIGISSTILRKPGKLTDEEWVIMRQHCQIGHDILAMSQAPLFQLAADIALSHHERWDGSGYPNALAGAVIPEAARIVAVADVFDALTMKRPYKEEWPIEHAVATIHAGCGGHFDPDVIAQFDQVLPELLEIKHFWGQSPKT